MRTNRLQHGWFGTKTTHRRIPLSLSDDAVSRFGAGIGREPRARRTAAVRATRRHRQGDYLDSIAPPAAAAPRGAAPEAEG